METYSQTGALLLDLQDKLIANVNNSQDLIDSNCIWLNVCDLLGINCVITEQVPDKLGQSCDPVRQLAQRVPVIAKDTFSAFGSEEFSEIVRKTNISHLVITGVETAICVYLTALEALSKKLKVTVLSDCVSGRRRNDSEVALADLSRRGVTVLPLETFVYSLLESAAHDQFKAVSALIKNR
jgi:nicotinamidase-related amidase